MLFSIFWLRGLLGDWLKTLGADGPVCDGYRRKSMDVFVGLRWLNVPIQQL